MKRPRHFWRYGITAALVASGVGAGLAPGLSGIEAAPASAGALAQTAVTAPVGLSAEAARMYVAVRRPRPGELGWQRIPWSVDLLEAKRTAAKEKRPLLLFVSGDDPLEKC